MNFIRSAIPCLLFYGGITFVQASNFPVKAHEQAFCYTNYRHSLRPILLTAATPSGSTADTIQATKENPPQTQDTPNKLEELLRTDIENEGLVKAFISGLIIFYSAISGILLYPTLSFLLLLMTIILVAVVVLAARKIKKGKVFSGKIQLFLLLYLFVYVDLLLIIYERSTILFSCLAFEKDILLVLLSAFVGFIGGKQVSKQSFEEERIP